MVPQNAHASRRSEGLIHAVGPSLSCRFLRSQDSTAPASAYLFGFDLQVQLQLSGCVSGIFVGLFPLHIGM